MKKVYTFVFSLCRLFTNEKSIAAASWGFETSNNYCGSCQESINNNVKLETVCDRIRVAARLNWARSAKWVCGGDIEPFPTSYPTTSATLPQTRDHTHLQTQPSFDLNLPKNVARDHHRDEMNKQKWRDRNIKPGTVLKTSFVVVPATVCFPNFAMKTYTQTQKVKTQPALRLVTKVSTDTNQLILGSYSLS